MGELLSSWRDGTRVVLAGRLVRVRDHGGVVFGDLADDSASVQLRVTHAADHFVGNTDRGDLILVAGECGRSRTGDRVVDVEGWTMQAKALRHPSADHQGLTARMSLLRRRAQVVRAVRQAFADDGFVEVETPVLHAVHGGASARPFETHINAYHQDLSLRIAPELYLKRLLVAGSGPIFEVSRNFRNEGVDATHNPEFTSVEAYRPFADYHDMRLVAQRIVRAAALAARGVEAIEVGGEVIDISGDWPVVAVTEAVSSAIGHEVSMATPRELLSGVARDVGIDVDPRWGVGALIEELYSHLVEGKTVGPTFYIDFPVETSPLARQHRRLTGLAERWDLVVGGMELGTAYGADRSPGAARATHRPVVSSGGRESGGDGGRRGLPRGTGNGHATHGGNRHRARPVGDVGDVDTFHPGRAHLPLQQTPWEMTWI